MKRNLRDPEKGLEEPSRRPGWPERISEAPPSQAHFISLAQSRSRMRTHLIFRRQISSSDRTLIAAFREIRQMADRLNLPQMIPDRANTLFKQVHESTCPRMKGKSSDAIASACLYIACRQEAVPRTFKVQFRPEYIWELSR